MNGDVFLLSVVFRVSVYADPYEDLVRAVQQRNVEAIQKAINNGADINKTHNLLGKTPLMIAVKAGELEIVKLFLAHGATPNITNEYGQTLLMEIASRGDANDNRRSLDYGGSPNKGAEIAKLLLDYDIDPDKQDDSGRTAMMLAAYYANPGVVKVLWEHGADPTIKENDGRTLEDYRNSHNEVTRILQWLQKSDKDPLEDLVVGVEYNDVDLVKKAIENGANANSVVNKDLSPYYGAVFSDFTPFLIAAHRGYTEIIHVLIEQGGADVNSFSSEKGTALLMAVHWVDRAKRVELVQYLLEHGAEAQSKTGTSPISVAEKRGYSETVELLQAAGTRSSQTLWEAILENDNQAVKNELKNGANANDPILLEGKFQHQEPLWVAVELGYRDIAKTLIGFSADVNALNAQSSDGATVLHVAAEAGYEDIVKLLVQNGADPEAQIRRGFYKGWTPLMLAEMNGHSDVTQFLQKEGARTYEEREQMKIEFLQAAASGELDKVEALLNDGVDVNIRLDAIQEIQWNGQVNSYSSFLMDEGKYGEALMGLLKNFQLKGTTALILAINEGHTEIVSLLLDKGAKVNGRIQGRNGDPASFWISPLLLASYTGNADIIQMLLDHGADINGTLQSNELGGKTALGIAISQDHIEAVQLLLQAGAKE